MVEVSTFSVGWILLAQTPEHFRRSNRHPLPSPRCHVTSMRGGGTFAARDPRSISLLHWRPDKVSVYFLNKCGTTAPIKDPSLFSTKLPKLFIPARPHPPLRAAPSARCLNSARSLNRYGISLELLSDGDSSCKKPSEYFRWVNAADG